jgi:hypothetical protein
MAADPRRVKELFGAALEVPDLQNRQAYLERQCAGDADLRQRLEAPFSRRSTYFAKLGAKGWN